MLHKQIMCGVCNLSIQCKLLAEFGLTFKIAFEFDVLSSKSADRNATDIQRTVTVAVNMVQKTSEVHARSTCYRCGGKLHNGRDGQLDTYSVCYKCGKHGHLSGVCCSPEVTAGTKGTRGKGPPAEVQQVKQPPTEEEEKYMLFTLCREGFRAPLNLDVVADGVQLSMEVDVWTIASIISKCTYR